MNRGRYEGVLRVIELALALQSPGRGLCLDEIAARFEVCRKTALRMRDAVGAIFPELHYELGPDGRRYWKLRRGSANGVLSWTLDEIAALEAAIHWASDAGLAHRERALRAVADKVKALVAPIRVDAVAPPALAAEPASEAPPTGARPQRTQLPPAST